ncbi:MAG: MBL fold metallo-hydrolase [Gammaproteobacteria bacterium]|nr:MBL fold metallo-hydrolase [Gammaproteobacteria bacterium]
MNEFNKWFSVTRIDEHISLIHENHIASWMRCNIWHIRGRHRDLLIDSGMGLVPLKPFVSRFSDQSVTAISSHGHFDHMGGAHEFEHHWGHPGDSNIYANPTGCNTLADDFVSAEVIKTDPFDGFDIAEYRVKPAPLTGYLDDGDIIDLGDRILHVLHLPGHSPGSIALYDPAEKTLFSGDIIYDGGLIDDAYHSSTEIYEESLRRLRELPVSVVHGGHEGSFGQSRMIELIDLFLAGGQRLGWTK